MIKGLLIASNKALQNKKRRNSKRKALEDEQGKRVKSIAARINTVFEARKTRV